MIQEDIWLVKNNDNTVIYNTSTIKKLQLFPFALNKILQLETMR